MRKNKSFYNEEHLGLHRVLEPSGVLPQQASILDPSLPLRQTELLIGVDSIHVDSSSFHQLLSSAKGDVEKTKQIILDLVRSKGKLHNPITGSGGMLLGTVLEKGKNISGSFFEEVQVGDRVASLVSLTLTPLQLDKIIAIDTSTAQLKAKGHAILFSSGNLIKIPQDMEEKVVLSILDVCGAPAQVAKLLEKGKDILILGGGRSALLCLYVAKKIIKNTGKVIVMEYEKDRCRSLKELSFVDEVIQGDARDALSSMKSIEKVLPEKADIVVNLVNVPDTEATSILSVKDGGLVYFFSMATKFSTATLSAEGVCADVSLMMGNGYSPGHANYALNLIRESKELFSAFQWS